MKKNDELKGANMKISIVVFLILGCSIGLYGLVSQEDDRPLDSYKDGELIRKIGVAKSIDKIKHLLPLVENVISNGTPKQKKEVLFCINYVKDENIKKILLTQLPKELDKANKGKMIAILSNQDQVGLLSTFKEMLDKETDTDLRKTLWMAISKMNDDSVTALIKNGYSNEKNETLKIDLLEYLASRKVTEIIENISMTIASTDDAKIQSRMVNALGNIWDDSAKKTLVSLLSSENLKSAVKIELLEILAKMKEPKAVEEIVKAITSTKEAGTQMRMIHALGKIGGDSAKQALLSLLASEKNIETVLEVLGKEKLIQSSEIKKLISDSKLSVRRSILALLCYFHNNEDVISALFEFLESDKTLDGFDRTILVNLLLEVGNKKTLEKLNDFADKLSKDDTLRKYIKLTATEKCSSVGHGGCMCKHKFKHERFNQPKQEYRSAETWTPLRKICYADIAQFGTTLDRNENYDAKYPLQTDRGIVKSPALDKALEEAKKQNKAVFFIGLTGG